MVQAEDCGDIIRYIACLPPHVCINEIWVTPTWNRGYVAALGRQGALNPDNDKQRAGAASLHVQGEKNMDESSITRAARSAWPPRRSRPGCMLAGAGPRGGPDQDRRHRRELRDRGRRDPERRAARRRRDQREAAASTAARSRSSPMTTTIPRPTPSAPSSAPPTRTRCTPSSRAISARSCSRWSHGPARLHLPMITPGAASNDISKAIHDDYDRNKYVFHGYLTSAFLADSVCDGAKDLLVDGLHMKTAVVMSEDAAWTTPLDAEYLKCLPKVGLQGARPHPLLARHDRLHADLQPDRGREARRHRHRHQPCRRAADGAVDSSSRCRSRCSASPRQATSSTFWKDTNGATEGVVFQTVAAPGVAVTPKTVPFTEAYVKKYGVRRPMRRTRPMTRST